MMGLWEGLREPDETHAGFERTGKIDRPETVLFDAIFIVAMWGLIKLDIP